MLNFANEFQPISKFPRHKVEMLILNLTARQKRTILRREKHELVRKCQNRLNIIKVMTFHCVIDKQNLHTKTIQ